MSEFRESKKMKVVQLYEWTQKLFLNPTPIRAPKSPKLA